MKQITNRYKRYITKDWAKHPKPFSMHIDNKKTFNYLWKYSVKNHQQSQQSSNNPSTDIPNDSTDIED